MYVKRLCYSAGNCIIYIGRLFSSPHKMRCHVFLFLSTLDVLVHICMSVAVWHHNSSHLWCLCSFIRSLPFCSSAALCKLRWFILFFLHTNDPEHTGKATVCRGVWDIICHNHFTDEGTITTSAESSRHTLTSSGLRRENYTASVLCCLWSTWMTFCFVFFQCHLQVSHSL